MANTNPQIIANAKMALEEINYIKSSALSLEKISEAINSLQLNNQEQGEWTPKLTAGNNNLMIKNFPAIFFRIGKLVYYSCDLTVVQYSKVPNSPLEIDGLPYLSIDKHWQPGNVSFSRNIEIESNITSLVIPWTKKIRLYDNPNGESVGLKSDNLAENSRIILSGSYIISHPQ